MTKIAVEKRLLIGLAVICGLALLAGAFLLGRGSAGRTPPTSDPSGSAPAVQAKVAAPMHSSEPGDSDPRAAQPLSSIPAGHAAPEGDPFRSSVVAYFHAIDRIQPGRMDDPDATAKGIVGSLTKGDASSFKGMLQRAAATRERLAGLTPPTPCAAYHQESLAVLDDGIDLMRTMQQVMEGTSAASAPDLNSRASALKARTDALQEMERGLRQRYGISR